MTNPVIELPITTVVQILTALGVRELSALIGYRDDDISTVIFHILGPKLPPDERRKLALKVLAEIGTPIPATASPQQILDAMDELTEIDVDTPEFAQAQTAAAALALVANQIYAAQIILGSGPTCAFGWMCARDELRRADAALTAEPPTSATADEILYLARQLIRVTVPVGEVKEFPVAFDLVQLPGSPYRVHAMSGRPV